jgi:SulP family sulfate permease
MSELPQFVNTIRIAPKSDVTVLLLCFGLTVIFDMVIAIVVGVVLAALLFMKRMGELAGAKVVLPSSDQRLRVDVPDGVALYDIQGPLFFGAAKNAMSAIGAIASAHPRAVVIHLGNVPVIDATGLVALDSAIGSMLRQKVPVVLAGPLPKPERIFAKARLTTKYEHLRIAPTLAEAFTLASRFEPAPLSRKSMTPAPPGTLPGSSRPSATPARPSVIPRGPGEAP